MSYGKGRSPMAQKERQWLRKRPGTGNSTDRYLAQQERLKKQTVQQKTAWIDQVAKEFHDEREEN